MVTFYLLAFLLFCVENVDSAPKPNTVFNLQAVTRANKAHEMLRTKSCLELIGSKNCTYVKSQLPHDMQFFMASKENGHLKIVKALGNPTLVRGLNGLGAVVVVDTIPDAHYGHKIVVMPIKTDIEKSECDKLKGLFYNQAGSLGECMFLPNYSYCLRLKQMKKNRACAFHSIPKVYDVTDNQQKNILKCLPNIQNFGKCPIVNVLKFNPCDNNSGNCKGNTFNQQDTCERMCDHAVILSGGWNKYMNKVRHLKNIKDMHRYLHEKKDFKTSNIKVFFANNGTINLDKHTSTRDTYPATDANAIIDHIKKVCTKRPQCIDTFVLYLNGPALPNGNIMLWDRDSDGKAAKAEIIEIPKLLEPLKTCNAKNFLIIADQNYAGHIIGEVVTQKNLGYDNFKRVHVIAASTRRSYSWGRDFTKKFIELDNVHIDSRVDTSPSRKISLIYKDLQKMLPAKYRLRYHKGENADLTVTGKYGSEAGCILNK
ncbi:uncharacterized protein LOC130622051 isoform X1 [Hydractinia symbiolongicarpus]|uniref:uncharacterized protein LOC130622051 isoform X1 n=1 Tax=Hydractinia symbiolongicarpus TaxID=13093 RepID=UPI00254BB9B3|nr:uncharacterized protein LOC130622051 isoform X1 [Hydractinia symbiolongicarpus]